MLRSKLILAIKKASGVEDVNLESPENTSFGDYSTNVALHLKGSKPRVKAEEIVSKLNSDKDLKDFIEKIEVAGPGFINFHLNTDVLINNLTAIDTEKEKYGVSNIGKDKTVVIDYSSPNIAKPFGIGHLRSTIIGQALYNLYKTLGYEVVGDNHLGDWGTQFGKLLYMIKAKNVKEFDIQKLEELYVEFHKLVEEDPSVEEDSRNWFKRLEDGDSEAKEIWQKCIDASLSEFEKVYKLLNVSINFAFGESYYESEMKQLMKDPKVKKHLKVGENKATIIDLNSAGIKTPLMFIKSDGATTYATRDLATIAFRVRKWDPDLIIYEVGAEQTLHFRQLFAASRLIGLVNDKVKLVHTAHGLYLAPDGKKFSTRKGKTIKLEEVLTESVERAKKLGNKNGKIAQMVGVGAIKYFDLMHSVTSDVVFDWEKILNLEGNSGPYLQYTTARINSVLEKAGKTNSTVEAKNLTEAELSLLKTLIKYKEVIEDAAKSYSPNMLCNYLYNLASKFNTFYNAQRIIGSSNEAFRLLLSKSVGQILKNGLNILGINTPQKM